MAAVLAPEITTYIINAFPNASRLLQHILSRYARELSACAFYGLSAVWDYVYDRLYEQDPVRIHVTSACEEIDEASASSNNAPSMPNGYDEADKKALEKILENATIKEKKSQSSHYEKKGTYDDAKKDLEKLSGNITKKDNVWVKNLPRGKTAIVREKSTYQGAKATLEIQKPNTKGVMIPIIKIRYVE